MGLNYQRQNIMNKYTKMFALVGAALLLGACQEELIAPEAVVVPGNEIQFGASACFEAGNEETRTIYGDAVVDENGMGLIEVEWVPGTDRIDIACPQAVGSTNSEYMVMENNGETNGTTADNFSSTTLTRISPVGLQWSTSETHNFYAAYPSAAQIGKKLEGKLPADVNLGIDPQTGILSGFVPVEQSPADMPAKGTTSTGRSGYKIDPDMTYAYMVANKTHTKGQDANIGLLFASQVTALEFEIVANQITQSGGEAGTIKVLGMQLFSAKNKPIAGDFKIDVASKAFTPTTKSGYEKLYVEFGDGLTLAQDEAIQYTFFLLPDADIVEGTGDLSLTVIYTSGSSPFTKTATISAEIVCKKKYFFKNVLLPQVDLTQSGSSWFSALNPATYISQLSIPVAGNAFSYLYAKQSTDLTGENSPEFYCQQVKDYTELWSLGVRGFEFKTSYNSSTNSLGGEYFVCKGMEMNPARVGADAPTFDSAFKDLYSYLKQNPGETLIIVATYQSHGDGDAVYSPAAYVADLEQYLGEFFTYAQGQDANIKSKDDLFVKLGTQSTVADLQNKIAIVVRPYDADYMKFLGKDPADVVLTDNWSGHVALVHDWGTSIDQWDKRYAGVYCQGEYTYSNSNKSVIEDNLWLGMSSSSSSYSSLVEKAAGTWPTASRTYYRTMDGNASAVWVQCWERIFPTDMIEWTGLSDGYAIYEDGDWYPTNHTAYLWIKWPGSLTEKKAMIAETLTKSRGTIGDASSTTLYINSLSGFFATTNLRNSLIPFRSEYSHRFGSTGVSDAIFKLPSVTKGQGGDWASCAAEMNYTLSNELDNTTAQGPLGLIMFDYIGAESSDFENISAVTRGVTDQSASVASKALPLQIMLNNFKFPLATKVSATSLDDDNTSTGQGEGSGGAE